MYDEEVEKTVLYYIIFENEQLNINDEDFFIAKHKQIVKAIFELKRKKEEVNLISINNMIKGKGSEVYKYIASIAESKYGSSIDYAYKELKRLSKKRKLLRLSKEIQEELSNEMEIEIYIEKKIKELSEINQEGEKEKTFLDIVCETSEIIEKKRLQGSDYDYKYFTGIFDLDKVTNGLHEEELTIIGARPRSRKNNICIANRIQYRKEWNCSWNS